MIEQQPLVWSLLRDSSDSIAQFRIHVLRGVTREQGLAAAETISSALASFSVASVVERGLTIKSVQPGIPVAGEGSDVRRVALFFFMSEDEETLGIVEIPVLESLIVQSSCDIRKLDEGSPAVVAMVSELASGFWTLPDGTSGNVAEEYGVGANYGTKIPRYVER